MSLRTFTSLSLLLVASLGTVAACSSDSDGPAAPATSSSTTRISAKNGGKVSDPSGKATLTISAGALAEDTDITLSVSAATSETVAGIYDFGPDGLTFLKPATLEIAVDVAAVGDKQVAVALETDGKFMALAGSNYANGVAQAEIEHFSKFTVVFVDGKAQKTSCDDAVEAFVACGGDVTGTWVADEMCLAGIEADTPADCPKYELSLEVGYDEGFEYSFGADGSYENTGGVGTATRTANGARSCFRSGKKDSCEGIDNHGICTGDTVCTCTYRGAHVEYRGEGTYTTEDGVLTFSAEGKSNEWKYCVQGNTMILLGTSRGAEGTPLLRLARK